MSKDKPWTAARYDEEIFGEILGPGMRNLQRTLGTSGPRRVMMEPHEIHNENDALEDVFGAKVIICPPPHSSQLNPMQLVWDVG